MHVLNVIMSVPPKNMVIKMPSYSVQNMGKSQQYGTEISYFIRVPVLNSAISLFCINLRDNKIVCIKLLLYLHVVHNYQKLKLKPDFKICEGCFSQFHSDTVNS